jgi:fatty-acyl-CoA synthase
VAGVGGAPCALAILEAWANRGVEIVQGYGMTETSPGCTVLDAEDAVRKVGSAGKPLLHTEVRIVDENGDDVAPGQVGELWTRGPNITPGYWNKPEATANSFDDGWLKTGDAARKDDEGFIYIVDRWKDMHISGGENVYPAEVRLARFKVPAHVEFVHALPHNATGKVLKRELRTQFVGTDAHRPSAEPVQSTEAAAAPTAMTARSAKATHANRRSPMRPHRMAR